MDINATDFAETFDKKNATVGIIGQGFVGSAMKAYFDTHEMTVVAHDKFKSETAPLIDVVTKSDVIFVCVPTPMRQTGECYTGIVESVLDDIERVAKEVSRPFNSFVVCIKSTLPPGFTDNQRLRRKELRLVFSPEFLTEKNSVKDMLEANRIVVGGHIEDTRVVLHFFLAADRERVGAGKCALVHCDASVAEMSKLFTNGLLFTKVVFSNEIYKLCKALGISYNEVRAVTGFDPRVGTGHTQVPGPDGFLGAGGHCFPKDMHNLAFVAEQRGIKEVLFSAVLKRNGEVREEKDWEKMNDRAVTDK
jgi:UDPglucose 6-dehydrogenase